MCERGRREAASAGPERFALLLRERGLPAPLWREGPGCVLGEGLGRGVAWLVVSGIECAMEAVFRATVLLWAGVGGEVEGVCLFSGIELRWLALCGSVVRAREIAPFFQP